MLFVLLLCTGDVPDSYTAAAPTLYNVTYYLTAANFLGDSDTADTTYTAESYMHLDILQPTSNVTFNSLGLNYSQILYAVSTDSSAQPGVCLCGPTADCATSNCTGILKPSG